MGIASTFHFAGKETKSISLTSMQFESNKKKKLLYHKTTITFARSLLNVSTLPCINVSDINECDFDRCAMNAACENIDGSFSCSCNEGFSGDGISLCEGEQALLLISG